jgi:serine/threonine protein kinase
MAMKIIKLKKEGKNMKAAEAEINIGKKLGSECEYLVHMIDFWIENECYFLVMELCSGGDLQKILDQKKHLPKEVILFFFFILLFILLYFDYLLANT